MVDEHTTEILNDHFIFWTMLIPSNNSSLFCHSPSYQYPEWMINIELFINTTIWRKDAAVTVTMIRGDPVAFAEYCFINYLCQQVLWHEQDLEQNNDGLEHEFNVSLHDNPLLPYIIGLFTELLVYINHNDNWLLITLLKPQHLLQPQINLFQFLHL